jgi:hypothetical protein
LFRLLACLAVLTLPLVSQGAVVVRYDGGSLSVRADGTSRAEVLREVARRTGVDIQVLSPCDEELRTAFDSVPLLDGLHRLLDGTNFALTEIEGHPAVVVVVCRLNAGASPAITAGSVRPQQPRKGNRRAPARTSPMPPSAETTDAALHNPDATVQAAAVERLAERDRAADLPALQEVAVNGAPQSRLIALQALHSSTTADEATIVAALGRATGDEDLQVRGFAIRALAERSTPDALAYLRRALQDSEPSTRLATLESIVRSVPAEQGLPMLQEAMADPDETVRSAAASYLHARQGPR